MNITKEMLDMNVSDFRKIEMDLEFERKRNEYKKKLEENNELEVQDKYGIRENDLYSIMFEDEDRSRIFKVENCEIMNFAPCSSSAFKNESGLFIIRTSHIRQIIPNKLLKGDRCYGK